MKHIKKSPKIKNINVKYCIAYLKIGIKKLLLEDKINLFFYKLKLVKNNLKTKF